MRIASFIVLLFLILNHATGQSTIARYNDSCFRHLHDYFRSCKTLKSTKQASKDMVGEDLRLIALINRIYADTTLTVEGLRKEAAGFRARRFDSTLRSELTTVEFEPYTKGLLRVRIEAEAERGIVRHFKVQIETKGCTLCDGDWLTPGFFDFIYFERFLPDIRFPVTLKTHQAAVTLER